MMARAHWQATVTLTATAVRHCHPGPGASLAAMRPGPVRGASGLSQWWPTPDRRRRCVARRRRCSTRKPPTPPAPGRLPRRQARGFNGCSAARGRRPGPCDPAPPYQDYQPKTVAYIFALIIDAVTLHYTDCANSCASADGGP